MAIKTYSDKTGQTCYLIRCVSTSPRARVQKQLDLGAVSHTEAKAEHNKLKREVSAKRLEKERRGVTWRNLLDAWFKRDVLKCPIPTTSKGDNYNALLAYTKEWMDVEVDKLGPINVQVIFRDMERGGLGTGRMKTVKGAINAVFDWGKLERMIPIHVQSPARGAKVPKMESQKPTALTKKEIRFFLEKAQQMGHPYYHLWAVALNTGCRSGELVALQWTDVDLDRMRLSISKSYSSRLGRVKSTKTGEAREVPINPQLERLLKELRSLAGSSPYVLPRIPSWLRGEAARITRDFCRMIGLREVNFHAMRACFAIQCLETGNGMVTAMKLGGWKDVKSFQHYVRMTGADIEGETDGLDLIPAPAMDATVHNLPTKEGRG
jgi:integrase